MKVMFTCRDAFEASSLARETELSLADTVRWKAHLAMCSHCRRVGRQMELLRKAFGKIRDLEAPFPPP